MYAYHVQNLVGIEDATTYGKGATVRYWLKRGFAAGDPGSCDTWSASSAKVS
ncbi:hypothetical protein [Nonomuraea maritima]|uniref:hypothetical protein n=1 Tax=Nonomuraea maritima TaxID=683260 RepID=UPI00371ABBF5